MSPDYDQAAIRASETLIKHRSTFAPVDALKIVRNTPNAFALPFANAAEETQTERDKLLEAMGEGNRDAVTVARNVGGCWGYIIVWNQRLPFALTQRALARELAHIVLGHDGSRTEEARRIEAQTFAYHLLCPRPLIRAIQESDVPLTTEILGTLTGCYERCLAGMRTTPGADVPPETNRLLRDQFEGFVREFLAVQRVLSYGEDSEPVDFGTYMDGYEE